MFYNSSTINCHKNKGVAFIMNEPNEKTLAMGLRIHHARKSAGYTQMQFAEKSASPHNISQTRKAVWQDVPLQPSLRYAIPWLSLLII